MNLSGLNWSRVECVYQVGSNVRSVPIMCVTVTFYNCYSAPKRSVNCACHPVNRCRQIQAVKKDCELSAFAFQCVFDNMFYELCWFDFALQEFNLR